MTTFPLSLRALGARRLLLPGITLLLAACSGSGNETQIAAKVNKGEISIHQVQTVLQRQPRQIANDPSERATARVLEVLIDQELAAQAGADIGLDKDPRVVQAIEAARRELVARAYQERTAEKVVGPSSDEIDRYYDEHPELFAQRKLYVLRETGFDPEANVATVQSVVERAGSLEEIEKGLRDARVRFSGRALAHAAEDLPLDVLRRVASLGVGQSAMVSAPGATRIFTVLQALDAPVDRRTASGAIGAYLLNERKGTAVSAEMRRLRDGARIEYVGNFAAGAAGAASAAAR
ncbi:MAG: EpsD family peptidyl-prolyl cis-trans isomerase [Piscinibacter sp.]|nr:EpsD family peptidyl-prolyl cis-trans isomerase [Piscinibacter sp.]